MPTPHSSSGGAAAPTGPAAPAHHPHPHPHPHPAAPAHKIRFPFNQPALADFHTGARFFGAPRPGRKHAAVDLIAEFGRAIHAVADGTVIQSPYFFYLGTNALEVHHPGLGTVRYGEVSIVKAVHLKGGDHVKQGDVIAYVGRLDTGASMLHFELYSGNASGGLTNTSNPPYQRRSDLVNPTHLMERLQREAFGH